MHSVGFNHLECSYSRQADNLASYTMSKFVPGRFDLFLCIDGSTYTTIARFVANTSFGQHCTSAYRAVSMMLMLPSTW